MSSTDQGLSEPSSWHERCQLVCLSWHYKSDHYYRLRRVREACPESIPQEMSVPRIIPVEPMLLRQKENICGGPGPGLDISIKGCSIHITDETSMQLLATVLEVMRSAQ